MAETVTDRMRRLVLEARTQKEAAKSSMTEEEKKAWKAKKHESDIKAFFESEIKAGALDKIEKRAKIGANSANIMEYKYDEYFKVTGNGKIVRVPAFTSQPGVFLHKMYKVVTSEAFKDMLNEYVSTLGGMKFVCWSPKKDLNVVEVYWGPTKNHTWETAEDDDSDSSDGDEDSDDEPDGDGDAEPEVASPPPRPADAKPPLYRRAVESAAAAKK